MTDITRVSRPDSWRREFIRANRGRCHYCNRTGALDVGPDERSWHVDHMKAIARGGADDEDNLVLACKRCNLAKGVQPYNQFAAFAHAAFWVPDDWRISEAEIDSLMRDYEQIEAEIGSRYGGDPTWCVDTEAGRIVWTGGESVAGRFAEPLVKLDGYMEHCFSGGVPSDKRTAEQVLELISSMHRLMPSMIAEIRMLRAEVAESAKTDEAAA